MDKSIHLQHTEDGWKAFFNDETASLWFMTPYTAQATENQVVKEIQLLNPDYQIKVIRS